MTDMIETVAVHDTFITSLEKIEQLAGNCLRFYLCARDDGENVLRCKLVIPAECFDEIVRQRMRMMTELRQAS